MRKKAVWVVLGLLAAMINASGCGDDTGTETSSGTAPQCEGLLARNECFNCVEASCCTELAACLEDNASGGCADCVAGDRAACANPRWQAVFTCGDQKCASQCKDLGTRAPACDAPDPTPSGGACVTLGGARACNPITNEGCDSAAGQACDFSDAAYKCFPPPNDRALCESCDPGNGVFCAAGLSCVTAVSIDADGVTITRGCARSCCDDADCGTGTCRSPVTVDGETVGQCLTVVTP